MGRELCGAGIDFKGIADGGGGRFGVEGGTARLY